MQSWVLSLNVIRFCHFVLFNLIIIVVCDGTQHNRTCILNAITSTKREIIAAHNLAAQYLNKEHPLSCNIEIKLYNSNSIQEVTSYSVDIIENANELVISNTSIEIPIVLAADYSTHSAQAASILNIRYRGVISSTSTYPGLSEFPYFYRTVPDDSIQIIALIELLLHFNWTTFGIIYDNDVYGSYLSSGIQELAKKNNITSYTSSYVDNVANEIDDAVREMKETGVYIIILISHDYEIKMVTDSLLKYNMLYYPYYPIAVDAWMNMPEVLNQHIENRTAGVIGTFPWKPNTLHSNDYEGNLKQVYDQSSMYYDVLYNEWQNNPELVYNKTIIGWESIYAWDTVFTMHQSLQIFDEKYSLESIFNRSFNASKTLNLLDKIIRNDVLFLGLSGNVSFTEDGNRQNKLYSFGNMFANGSVKSIGYIFIYPNGSVLTKINDNDIVWPINFIEKGHIPWSEPLKVPTTYGVSQLTIILISIGHLALFILGCLSCLHIKRRKNESNVNLSLLYLMNIGLFLCIMDAILYGMQNYEQCISNINQYINIYSICCNVHLWFMSLVFSLIIIPLFAQEYQFKTFIERLKNKKKEDIVKKIVIAICGDILILFSFSLMNYLYNKPFLLYRLLSFEEKTDDALVINVKQYPTCSSVVNWEAFIFYLIILVYKFGCLYYFMAFKYKLLKALGITILIFMREFVLYIALHYNWFDKESQYITYSVLIMAMNFAWIISTLCSGGNLLAFKSGATHKNDKTDDTDTLTDKDGENPNRSSEFENSITSYKYGHASNSNNIETSKKKEQKSQSISIHEKKSQSIPIRNNSSDDHISILMGAPIKQSQSSNTNKYTIVSPLEIELS